MSRRPRHEMEESESPTTPRSTSRLSRRELLSGAGALLLVGANGPGAVAATSKTPLSSKLVGPTDPAVEARERKRRRPGAGLAKATVTASPIKAIVGGREVATWAFGERPGAGGIRAKVGDVIEATFVNKLPSGNTLHWHGIALRNDMDGVHGLTQAVVEPGRTFTYRFTAPDAGTYWFHPHMGLELDKGLYAPLIIEDPNDPVDVDVDATLMLDDWLDGYGRTQEQVLAELETGGGHSHHMGNMGNMTGGSASGLTGDVTYPLHVINGRGPNERETVTAKPGQRVRIRLINAGSDTAYRVAVADHRLTVTHADGFPVTPVVVDTVLLGMGERYDVVVTAKSGAFAIVAVPEGKADPAGEAVLRTTTTAKSPALGSRPSALEGRALRYSDLRPTDAARLADRKPTRTVTIALTAKMSGYIHGINGRSFPDSAPIMIRQGERLRLRIMNDTMMFHPIHLHGHTFQVVGSSRKDTVNVPSMSAVEVDIEADNPGQWMLHCHNTYHLETGMATVLSYRR
jgi:FtsP/CotA-like multicopper oxidase with cupredoxin domain